MADRTAAGTGGPAHRRCRRPARGAGAAYRAGGPQIDVPEQGRDGVHRHGRLEAVVQSSRPIPEHAAVSQFAAAYVRLVPTPSKTSVGSPTIRRVRNEFHALQFLVEADEAAGEPDIFVLYYPGGGERPSIIGHGGWPEDAPPPSSVEVDEMEDRGWVRVTKRDGQGRHFAVTREGRSACKQHAEQLAPRSGSRVDLSWSAALPVLHLLYEEYVGHSAPEAGIKTLVLVDSADDPASMKAAIRELARDGYLEIVFGGQGDVPVSVRPTPKALQLEAGWPGSSAEAAIGDLVEALNSQIASTADTEEKSALVKVRDGLLGAARDFVVAYLAKKMP
jgi:hypothetical protein